MGTYPIRLLKRLDAIDGDGGSEVVVADPPDAELGVKGRVGVRDVAF